MFGVAEFGTDFKSSYTFTDGDLELVSDAENISQSLTNRINTYEGTYDLFYNTYGGFFRSFLGWVFEDDLLDLMKIELENILNQDPRFEDEDYTLELTYENGSVNMSLDLRYDDDSDLSLSYVIDDTGTIVEDTEDGY